MQTLTAHRRLATIELSYPGELPTIEEQKQKETFILERDGPKIEPSEVSNTHSRMKKNRKHQVRFPLALVVMMYM